MQIETTEGGHIEDRFASGILAANHDTLVGVLRISGINVVVGYGDPGEKAAGERRARFHPEESLVGLI